MIRSIILSIFFFASPGFASDKPPATDATTQPAEAEVATEERPQEEDRMICERKKQIGSNRIERICMTASQRRAARERARNDLQRLGACNGNDRACGRSI